MAWTVDGEDDGEGEEAGMIFRLFLYMDFILCFSFLFSLILLSLLQESRDKKMTRLALLVPIQKGDYF
jgi:hypothetical protein